MQLIRTLFPTISYVTFAVLVLGENVILYQTIILLTIQLSRMRVIIMRRKLGARAQCLLVALEPLPLLFLFLVWILVLGFPAFGSR